MKIPKKICSAVDISPLPSNPLFMQPDESRPLPWYTWIIILAATLAGLAFVFFFVVPNCANLPVRGIEDHECGIGKMAVIYVCSVMFLGAAGFSMYKLFRALSEGRKE